MTNQITLDVAKIAMTAVETVVQRTIHSLSHNT